MLVGYSDWIQKPALEKVLQLFLLPLILCTRSNSCSAPHLPLQSGPAEATWQPPSADTDYRINHFGAGTGLGSSYVNSITQTKDGYLWFATYEGLVRFDGQVFSAFTPTPSTLFGEETKRDVTHVLSTDEGRSLWAAYAKGLAKLTPDGVDLFVNPLFQTQDRIWRFSRRNDGGFWVFDDVNVHVFDRGTWTVWKSAPTEATKGLKTMLETSDGTLVAGGKQGVWRLDKDSEQWIALQPEDGSPTGRCLSLLETRNGHIWASTSKGLFVCEDASLLPVVQIKEGFHPLSKVPLLQARTGQIWMSVPDVGLFEIDPDGGKSIRRIEFFRNKPVGPIFEDSRGSLWVSVLGQGVFRLNPKKLTELTEDSNGSPIRGARCVYRDREGTLWIGTRQGAYKYANDEFHLLSTHPEAPDDYTDNPAIEAFAEDALGRLWYVGRGYLGLIQNERCIAIHQYNSHGHLNFWFTSLFSDGYNRLWLGHNKGLAWLDPTEIDTTNDEEASKPLGSLFFDNFHTFDSNSAITGAEVIRIGSQDTTSILVTTRKRGVFRIPLGARDQSKPSADDSWQGHEIVGTVIDDADQWILTESALYHRDDKGQHLILNRGQGLPEDQFNFITGTQGRWLWIGGNQGIHRIEKKDLHEWMRNKNSLLVPIITYGPESGLSNPETPETSGHSNCTDQEGNHWFPTISGVVKIESTPTQPPEVLTTAIRSIHVGGEPAWEGWLFDPQSPPSIRINSKSSRTLRVFFSANTSTKPEAVIYHWKLEGFDDDWTTGQESRDVLYHDLPQGTFRFTVSASRTDGVRTGTPATATIIVDPRYYETKFFAALSVLLTLFVVGALYRQRVQSLRRVHDLNRETALRNERLRIARDLHDDMSATLTRMAVSCDSTLAGEASHRGLEQCVREMADTSRELVDGIQNLVWANHPTNDNLRSAVAQYRSYAANTLDSAGLQWKVTIAPTLDSRELGPLLRRNVFLCVKEAIQNILKHAEAQSVDIRFELIETDASGRSKTECLRIRISDDGQGFDSETLPGSGFGLQNMRERICQLHGLFKISSKLNTGTTLEFIVPLQA